MKNLFRRIVFLSVLPYTCLAQELTIEGQILSITDSSSIPYATLGIDKKSYGTVANGEGIFRYSLSKELLNDTLIFSCVGYYPQQLCVKELPGSFRKVYLKPKVTLMNEVVVKPKSDCKTVELGKANHAGLGSCDFYWAREDFDDNRGRELGAIINLNPNKIYNIQNLNVYVLGGQFKKVLFRVCFYKVINGKVGSENILSKDIHWEMKNPDKGWITLDLKGENIILSDLEDVVISLQWINSEAIDKNSKYFPIKASYSAAKNFAFRDKSNSEWEINNGNISIFLTALSCSK